MPIPELVNNFFTKSGPGGIVVISVIVFAAVVYYMITRWILNDDIE